MEKERNVGLDLLKLVFMFMVCVLHIQGQGGILGACEYNTSQFKAYYFIEVLCFCAADGFALISGYTAKDKPIKYERIINMWVQVVFYSFVITAIFSLIGYYTWDKSDIIRCLMPVTYGKFWYFTAYFALFFIAPVINKYVFSIDNKTAKRDFIIIFLIFSVLGIINDPFISVNGYSTLWLIVLYLLGALANRGEVLKNATNFTLIILWFVLIGFSWGLYIYENEPRYINYISPTIVLSGLIMIVLFSRLSFKAQFISKIVTYSFGIYLFQLNQFIWNNVILSSFADIAKKTINIGIPLVCLYALCLFVIGLIVDIVRSILFKVTYLDRLGNGLTYLISKITKKVIK